MKKIRLLAPTVAALAATVFAPRAAACPACDAASAPVAESTAGVKPAAPAGHPLRGVVVEVLAAEQSLLVRHEEIPGVMKAMTMLFKVDAATLAAAKKGRTITATLVKKTDGWWLEDVKAAPKET